VNTWVCSAISDDSQTPAQPIEADLVVRILL
jgi:hypothetical protein